MLHPILMGVNNMTTTKWKIHSLNEKPQLENAIYAINHSCRYDVPIAIKVIDKHTYVLVGKQRLRLIDKMCFRLNGVIYVDRKDKASRKAAGKAIVKYLLKGKNVCIFPEGTWNLSPSRLLLPLYWGGIEIAREANVPIIPLVLEYRGYDIYVKWGAPIYVGMEDNKQDKINELSDSLATLKWDIWEMFPMLSRRDVNSEEWKQEVCRRLAEYPQLDYEYEKSCVLRI